MLSEHAFKFWRKKGNDFLIIVHFKELNPELNTQKDSVCAKLFTWLYVQILCYLHIFTLLSLSPRNYIYIYHIYIHSHFIHYWLDNDVKWMPKRHRIFELLTKMVFNVLNFLALLQFFIDPFIVKLFSRSLLLHYCLFSCSVIKPRKV